MKSFFKKILYIRIVRRAFTRFALLLPYGSGSASLVLLRLAEANLYAGDTAFFKRLIEKLEDQPLDYISTIRLAAILTESGAHQDGARVLRAKEIQEISKIKNLQLNNLKLRFFSEKWFSPIGHSALIDVFIKAQELGVIERKTNIIVGADHSFANPALIDLWQSYVSRIKNLNQTQEFIKLVAQCEEKLQFIEKKDGTVISLYALCNYVQLNWEKEGLGPLLSLSSKKFQDGYRVLEELGIPKGIWFCGLHNRSVKNNPPSARNASLQSYELAIKAITDRGGYVVYLGDEDPPPKWTSLFNFINYFGSRQRSDWMDIFLLAEGKFLLGLGSGPGVVPLCFGKPSVLVNWSPMAARHLSKNDLLLPKQYRLISENRFLTMSERMSSQYGHQDSLRSLALMGIEVVDNSPEEIADAVIEMMDQLFEKMNAPINTAEIAAQERFSNESLMLNLYPARLARNFIKRYPECFE